MNSRNLIQALAALAVLGGLAPAHGQSPVKIGLVDFARLQRDFYRTDVERKTFETKRTEEKAKVDERRAKLKDLLDAQEKSAKEFQDPTLSEDKRKQVVEAATERQGQLESLRRELIELEGKINAELSSNAAEVQKSLTDEIRDVVGQVAEAEGYAVVLNRSFGINGVPTVPYSSTELLTDLTDAIVKKLNENAPAGWTPPKDGVSDIKP